MPTAQPKLTDSIPIEETDRCVACGMCLPRCPTYRITRKESESPRGRISLMRALALGELGLSAALEAHLSNCLVCRACESVCPSGVRYGQLIDNARAAIEANRPRSLGQRWLRRLALDGIVARPAVLRRAAGALRLSQHCGLPKLLGLLPRRARTLRTAAAILPALPPQGRWRAVYPAVGKRRGTVALFTGCIASAVDRTTLESAVYVLSCLGYEIRVPAAQRCCGALHLHAGEPVAAARLHARNLDAFDIAGVEAVVSVASGCGATLSEYGLQSTDDRAAPFSDRVRDISQFLAEVDWPREVQPAALDWTVAIHDPCSLANVMHAQAAPYRVLERIPRLRAVPVEENGVCCGGAGAYLLDHPAMAGALRRPKLAHIRALGPDAVLTSNVGCALHRAAGLRDDGGPPLEVVHPVTLLARQIAAAGFKPDG